MLVLTELAVSRTVRDVAAVLDVVHGSEPGDLYLASRPARSYRAEVGVEPGKLRIGVLTRTPFGEIHPECLKATSTTAKLLESLGHGIEQSYPEALLDPDLNGRIRPLARPGLAAIIRGLGEALGRPATRGDVEPYLWSATELPPVTVDQYLATYEWLLRWRRRVLQWWSTGFDLLLTPTVWEPPVTLESMRPAEDQLSALRDKILRHVFFTWPFNVTGQPAISLPLHGLPKGCP